MYYFMSDIHGNARAYFALKAKIDFNSNDKLYILGNIFDGNSEHPEHCLAILDDNTLPHPPLEVFFTADEEIELAKRMVDGDEDAKKRLSSQYSNDFLIRN